MVRRKEEKNDRMTRGSFPLFSAPFRGLWGNVSGGLAVAAVGVALAAAPTRAVAAEEGAVFDPLEPFNRTIYGVNYVVDHVFLRPLAYAYRDGVPVVVRSKVSNALRNLKSPVILTNDLLQGEWTRAGDTSMRFLINTTFGLLGLFDVASEWGYPYHGADFGQTLAKAGVGGGPYLVLPLFGPSNARDAVGAAVDWFLDPIRLYGATQNPNWEPDFGYGRSGASALDGRTVTLDAQEALERGSIDTYYSMRGAYHQYRRHQVRNVSSSTDGSAFDFDE